MFKLSHQSGDSFHNFKCGEIFCSTAAVFNVTCCLCGSEMHLEEFSSHFHDQHLTLAEVSINLEALEEKRKVKLANDSCLLEHKTIKEEVTSFYPTKEDEDEFSEKLTTFLEEDTEDDEDNKCLQELVIVKKLNYREKLKEQRDKSVVAKKHFTRSAQSQELLIEEKIEDPLQTQAYDGEIVEAPLVVENLSKDEMDYNEVDDDNDEDNQGAEEEWSAEEKGSAEDSNHDKDELAFSCEICNISFLTIHGLQKHNYRVHNLNKSVKTRKGSKPKNKCDVCNEVFRTAPILRAHMWKHTGIFCDICGRSFTQSGHLKRHQIRHTGIKDFKCKECNKEFFTAKELKSHMVSHTKVMPVICEICGKGCRNLAVLNAHMRRHTGERPAKCEVCGKCFFSYHDLNVHAVTHTSERPFKCDICGSTFQRKKSLRVHKLIHSKDRKHVCKICGKGFAQSSGLNSHLRTHDAAVEKTATSSRETLYGLHIPEDALINSAGAGLQIEIDVMSGNRELEDQALAEYII